MPSGNTLSDESHHEKELGGQLLASVSRSFYLTLKALPRELREPISLAYLLARTADTLADTAQVPVEIRLEGLARCDALTQSLTHDHDAEQRFADELKADFAPHQTDPAEKALMLRTRDALAWLHTMSGAPLLAIRSVLATIISGQTLDLQRFPAGDGLHSLQTAEELDDYTYRVAGCVGEFWTKLCFSEMSNVFADQVTSQQASELGIRFGKALQLVNILRDLGKDAALGRCYLPQEQWQPLGLSLAQIASDPVCLRPVWSTWTGICEEHLRAGLIYIQSLSQAKLRYATALPLLLGARTLALMRKADDKTLRSGVKISRLEVAKILLDTTLGNSPEGLGRLFGKLLNS
jgi:farnesyl-diphosphate farnesyltransferase